MKSLFKLFTAILLISLGGILFTSCQEDDLTQNETTEKEIETRAQQVISTMNFNFFDHEDCFTINYPVTLVFPDGSTTQVNSYTQLFKTIQGFITQGGIGGGFPEIAYPFNITLYNQSVITVLDEFHLLEIIEACHKVGPSLNVTDNIVISETDCFDYVYPLTVVFPEGTTAEVNSFKELTDLLYEWEYTNDQSDVFPTLQMPFDVIYFEQDSIVKTISDKFQYLNLIVKCEYAEQSASDFYEIVDNMIGSCIEPFFPITINYPNGQTVTYGTAQELINGVAEWKKLYDQYYDEDPTFQFPLTVQYNSDGSTVEVHSNAELLEVLENC